MDKGWRICVMFLLTMLPLLLAAPLDRRVDTNAEDDLKNLHKENIPQQDQRDAKLSFDLSDNDINFSGGIEFSGSVNIQGGSFGHKLQIDVHEHSHVHHKDLSDNPRVHMAIDGAWTDWTKCSKTCEGGVQSRTCTNPAPQHGGKDCTGGDSQACNKGIKCTPSAIDGAWTDWTKCSKTCEGGVQSRTCTNPSPQNGGKDCTGEDSQACNKGVKCTPSDAVHGNYLQWSEYSSCSLTYGVCRKTRTRICTDPQNGGRTCEDQILGSAIETISCNDQDCPQVNENETLYEDDMILDAEQIAWLKLGLIYGELDGVIVNENTTNPESGASDNFVTDPNRKWPDKIVYYSIDGTLTSDQEQMLRTTLSGLQKKLSSCLTFQEKDQGNRVIVGTSEGGCKSHVGYKGTTQNLNLGALCWSTATIEHEFLHAIGIYHTQSRYDRDEYVRINWNNIDQRKKHNFNIYDRSTINDYGLPYDYESVMHYPDWAFPKYPGLKTIETVDPNKQDIIGNSAGVSKGDVKLVKCGYGCISCIPAIDGVWTDWTECSKTCEGGVQTRTCTNPPPQNGGKPCTGEDSQSCNDGVKCTPSGLVCTAGEINSDSCFCKSGNDDKLGEVCSSNQGCTDEGACNAVCPPGPHILQEDCFCKEADGGVKLCKEGFKCDGGECVNMDLKDDNKFDDNLLVPKNMSGPDYTFSIWTNIISKWENNVVPYYFNGSATNGDKVLVRTAMNRIQEETCFKFEEKTKDEYEDEHSLEILILDARCTIDVSGGARSVAYSKRVQLYLSGHITHDNGDDCGYQGLVIHNLMHVLGAIHTHQRKDRDDFISVRFENLPSGENIKDQYRKCAECQLFPSIPYDCRSIMHYGTHSYSRNGKEVIEAKDEQKCQLKKRANMFYLPQDATAKDYELLNLIGNCPGPSSPDLPSSPSVPKGPQGPAGTSLVYNLLSNTHKGLKYGDGQLGAFVPRTNYHPDNDEQQIYVPSAVSQDPATNVITITAEKHQEKWSKTKITSGRIDTKGVWSTAQLEGIKTRGYIEVRALMPAKTDGGSYRGAWPAIRMLGVDEAEWPKNGEIDIVELKNGDPSVMMTLHSTHHLRPHGQHPPHNPLHLYTDMTKIPVIFGLEWHVKAEDGQIDLTWWITSFDIPSQQWKNEKTTKSLFKSEGDAEDYAVFMKSFNEGGFYLLINLAQGGHFPGVYDKDALLRDGPQHVVIESAKVYEFPVVEQKLSGIGEAVRMDNIDYLFKGYDIMKGNPLPTEGLKVDPGYRQPIFKATYESGSRTADGRYLQPDGTTITDCNGTCSLSFQTVEISGSKSYQDTLSNKASFILSEYGAKFSASASYKNVHTTTSQGSILYTQSSASCCSYTALTLGNNGPPLSEYFLYAVESLTDEYKEDVYQKLIENFGTHYIMMAQMGALYGLQSEISKEAWTSMLEKNLTISTAASVQAYGVAVGTEFSNSNNKKLSEEFKSSLTSQKIFTIGVKPPTDQKVESWVQETSSAPAPMKLKLGSIVDLFDGFHGVEATDAVKKNMQKALNDYCPLLMDRGEVSSCEAPGPDPPKPVVSMKRTSDTDSGSVYLLAGGDGAERDMSLYHPSVSNIACSTPLPPLNKDWVYHSTFYHNNTIYLCGGIYTDSICISHTPGNPWKTHTLTTKRERGHSTVVLQDRVYFIGGWDSSGYIDAESTALPLTDTPVLTPVPNLDFKGQYQCTARIDKDTLFVVGGAWSLSIVSTYNSRTSAYTQLPQLKQHREDHGCGVWEEGNKKWIIVAGGYGDELLSTTEMLELGGDDSEWISMGNLNVARGGHSMAVTERGVMVMGGRDDSVNDLSSVELLDWNTKTWSLVEPSLDKPRTVFGGAVELPASMFGCTG